MSAERRLRRRMRPPQYVLDALPRLACADCSSDVRPIRREGRWDVRVAHDPGCPQLAFRERHGMTASAAVVSTDGRTLDPAAVRALAAAVAEGTDVVRVATDPNIGATERRRIEGARS